MIDELKFIHSLYLGSPDFGLLNDCVDMGWNANQIGIDSAFAINFE